MTRQFVLATEGSSAVRARIHVWIDVLVLDVSPETTFTGEATAIIATLPSTPKVTSDRNTEYGQSTSR